MTTNDFSHLNDGEAPVWSNGTWSGMNVIDYGQYNRQPNTTTEKTTVTKEKYDSDGKLVERTVESTEITKTDTGSTYPQVTYSNATTGKLETKTNTKRVKQELAMMETHPTWGFR